MNVMPRLALASPAGLPQPSPATLAWLDGLTERGSRVQYFGSRACPLGTEVIGQITGLPGRHLDAWLMPEPVLRSLFVRGASQADLALIEGVLDAPVPLSQPCGDCSGQLGPIVDAIDLPTIYLLRCPTSDAWHFPHIPDQVDAIFLDGLDDAEDFDRIRRFLWLATGKPVVGAIERLPEVRDAISRVPRDRDVPGDLIERMGRSFRRFADFEAIEALARSRPCPACSACPESRAGNRFRVAYAIDEAFGSYFPDTLEALESLGACLLDFSPLRDERLPDRSDLVMIGCGYPDRHLDGLYQNLSLLAELRAYVRRGQRLYAEGGGAAFLGRYLAIDGSRIEGAGILPFDAELVPDPSPPHPVERTLHVRSWLGPAGTSVRGYVSKRWRFSPISRLTCPRASEGSLAPESEIFFHQEAVGGLIHLHLAALADVMSAFIEPRHS